MKKRRRWTPKKKKKIVAQGTKESDEPYKSRLQGGQFWKKIEEEEEKIGRKAKKKLTWSLHMKNLFTLEVLCFHCPLVFSHFLS